MEAQVLVIIFLTLCGAGILLTPVIPASKQGDVLTWAGCLSSSALVWAGGKALLDGGALRLSLWSVPGLGPLSLSLDTLSAVFILVTGLVFFAGSVFAGGILRREAGLGQGRGFTALMLALYASSALILMAGDVLLLLFAWEAMSVLSYLLIAYGPTEDHDGAHPGYLLLAAGEAGTLAVVIGLLLLAVHIGSLDFAAIKAGSAGLSDGIRGAAFLLSFFGFGVKAGLVPVNFWLPQAYTVAPRAFVPILAGGTLNLGIYGIFRVNGDLLSGAQPGLGLLVLVVGTASAVLGILYATTENDLKTLLAHSSIENAGIVTVGFGAGLIFLSAGHPVPAAIAFTASLYHLVNHSLFKTLLFCGAGEIEERAGTRDMDRLGGLIKWMPLTAAGFLAGVLSIAGLPPFNGFISEWLTLQTMLRAAELDSTVVQVVFALCGAGLALAAGLAVTCFVKVFSMTFLGARRLDEERRVKEASKTALVSIFGLSVLCLALGALPTYVIPVLNPAVESLSGTSASEALVPPFFSTHPSHQTLPREFTSEFHDLGAQVGQGWIGGRGLVVLHRGAEANPVVFAVSPSYTVVVLVLVLSITFVLVRFWLARRRKVARSGPWDGGVRRLLPEMTYTATGFSNPVRVVFDAILRPTVVEDSRETVAQHFRTAIRRETVRVHLVEKLVLKPGKAAALGLARRLAAMHNGRINAYAAYVLIVLLVMLVMAVL